MNVTAMAMLQANDLGQKARSAIPGSEGGFTRILIILFIVGLSIAAVAAIRLIVKGCRGPRSGRTEES